MLVGHHAVGLAAKRFAPRVSLGTLQVAAILFDLLVFVDQLLGIEHARTTPGITAFSSLDGYDVAISHSLVTDVLWSAVFAAVYFWWRRDVRDSAILFAVVFSHWVLDVASHRPEIPLIPGWHRYVGLGLWNSIPGTFVVEGMLWLLGIAIYVRATRPSTPWATYGLLAFTVVLTLAWVATPYAPPPPGDFSVGVLMTGLIVFGGLCAMAGWFDRRRIVQPSRG